MTSSKSRHAFLKQKVDKRLAEQNEKQKRLAEEQKRSHEKRKEQAEALAERKLHEQKQADKQTRVKADRSQFAGCKLVCCSCAGKLMNTLHLFS